MIPLDSYCIQCYLRRNIEIARTLGTEEQVVAFAKDIMKLYLEAPQQVTAPHFGPAVADLLHDRFGLPVDRFHQEKIDSNRFILERMDSVRQRAEAAENPVLAGLRFAILGNYLDFSALQGQVSFERLEEMLTEAEQMPIDPQSYDAFRADLERGRTLLYLTDNAGEIGFDRIFAEMIQKAYPHVQITFCVRGDIAGNDATREDAAAVGLPFAVIDNGNRVAGTALEQLSPEARTALENADVILAKGMANTETMLGCGYNVYYAFLVKCARFVHIFGKPMMTPMFLRDNAKWETKSQAFQ